MNGLSEELAKQSNLDEMLHVLNKYYDLDNCKPSAMIKAILMPQLVKALEKHPAKGRTSQMVEELKHQGSITEVFQALKNFYDTKKIIFTPVGKMEMMAKLQSLLTMVRAKPRRQYV